MRTGCWMLLSSLLLALACADQGAVPEKSNAPKPTLPPMVSAQAPAEPPPGNVPPPAAAAPSSELHWTPPSDWVEVEPSSTMRYAQYRLPGAAGDAELAVFYFGPGQGGEPMANAERWAGQFKLADGSPALPAMKTSSLEKAGRSVLLVEVAGTYDGGMTMTAAPATPKPGYALLGAVVEGPDANWFFKLTGPEATVRGQRNGFLAMLDTVR